jgi:hypothetical protein
MKNVCVITIGKPEGKRPPEDIGIVGKIILRK